MHSEKSEVRARDSNFKPNGPLMKGRSLNHCAFILLIDYYFNTVFNVQRQTRVELARREVKRVPDRDLDGASSMLSHRVFYNEARLSSSLFFFYSHLGPVNNSKHFHKIKLLSCFFH